ncbi:divergent polysaccharide deacetylase family protein [Antarctobacter jejuensis]|uniref:divergent polysaccharide deacetylase family protein n=1 Tax=Antarctobacter jejuensis TaxID=1439938 RepID=UPI003FCF5B46
MARGFLSGVVWGGLFSGACLGAWSLSADFPTRGAMIAPPAGSVDSALLDATDPGSDVPADPPMPEVSEPVADPKDGSAPLIVQDPEAAEVAQPKPDLSQPGRRPVAETGVDRPEQPKASLNAPADPVVVGADTQPLDPPVVGNAPDLPGSGLPAPSAAPVIVGRDAPIKPGATAPLPGAPEPEAKPIIVTGPAQPPAPAVPEADSALVTPEPEVAEPVTPEPATPEVQTADPARPDPETPDPAAPGAEGPELAAVPPAPTPRPLFEQAQPLPEPEITTQAPVAPTIGKPARSLVGRGPQGLDDPAPGPDLTEVVIPLGAPNADSPLIRFSEQVEAPADVPRMAVVLVDDGSGPLGPSGLQSFPFPISFAIAPTHPDAAGAAKGYRDLGFEVLVLGDLPEGAQATDVEVTMSGILDAVPQAVAVLEAPGGSLQETRAIAGQVAAYLAGSGHGLVMQPKGLNTAQKLALKDGVPAVTIFRDFDGEGQDTSMIRRTLDQAAFRARQEGGVVMMGRLRADTITALVLWGLQDRSGTIALVPVSTVLTEAVAQP